MTLDECIEDVALPWSYTAPLFFVQHLFLAALVRKQGQKRNWGKWRTPMRRFFWLLALLWCIQVAVDIYRLAVLVPQIEGRWNRYQRFAAVVLFSPNFRTIACFICAYFFILANNFDVDKLHEDLNKDSSEVGGSPQQELDPDYGFEKMSGASQTCVLSMFLFFVLVGAPGITHTSAALLVYIWVAAAFMLGFALVGMFCLALFLFLTIPCPKLRAGVESSKMWAPYNWMPVNAKSRLPVLTGVCACA